MIAVLISSASAAFIGILSQVQHSKCTKINLCFGCFQCDRTVDNVVDGEEGEGGGGEDADKKKGGVVELSQIEKSLAQAAKGSHHPNLPGVPGIYP